jgi:hypothetical protein
MVPMDLNPFGEDRAAQRRARTFALRSRLRTSTTVTPVQPSIAERIGRLAGKWAARSRFATSITVTTFDLTAKLRRSRAVRTIWLATLLGVFVAAIVYSLVTGQGSGPS